MLVQTREVDTSKSLVRDMALRHTVQIGTHKRQRVDSALSARIRAVKLHTGQLCKKKTPMMRMRECRNALALLDTTGWNRSFHQRQFHEDFLKACTRTFWKMEPPGSFARCHQQVLQENSWEHLAQEVLISTPRRFGKTISVSMFAAAMLYSAPAVELSIYSTCKRISQKLLRGVVKFFYEICAQDLGKHNFRIRRQNMEEIVLVGPEGERDVRIVNSYPSKVSPFVDAWHALACPRASARQRTRAHTTRRPPDPGRAPSTVQVRLLPGAPSHTRHTRAHTSTHEHTQCFCKSFYYSLSYSSAIAAATCMSATVTMTAATAGAPAACGEHTAGGRSTNGAGSNRFLRMAACTAAGKTESGTTASSGVTGGVFIVTTT